MVTRNKLWIIENLLVNNKDDTAKMQLREVKCIYCNGK